MYIYIYSVATQSSHILTSRAREGLAHSEAEIQCINDRFLGFSLFSLFLSTFLVRALLENRNLKSIVMSKHLRTSDVLYIKNCFEACSSVSSFHQSKSCGTNNKEL